MDKFKFKEWSDSLEVSLDRKLLKWVKGPKIENGEAVHFGWQFEQTHIFLDIFWQDHQESVHFTYVNPRTTQRYEWNKLDDNVIDRIMDRVGNLAQVTMHPYKNYHRRSTDG